MKKLLILLLLLSPFCAYPQPRAIHRSIKVDSIEARNNKLLIKADTIVFKDSQNGLITLSELIDNKNKSIELKISKELVILIFTVFFLTCMFVFFCCLLIIKLFYKIEPY